MSSLFSSIFDSEISKKEMQLNEKLMAVTGSTITDTVEAYYNVKYWS